MKIPVRNQQIPNEKAVFTNVTITKGLANVGTLGEAASWADIDNDGYQDLLLGNLQGNFPNLLLFSNENSEFINITKNSQIGEVDTRTSAWADYDNDGFIDLVLGTTYGQAPPKLFKNIDGKTFKDVSDETGLNKSKRNIFQTVWGDYNLDGNIDLFTGQPRSNSIFI